MENLKVRPASEVLDRYNDPVFIAEKQKEHCDSFVSWVNKLMRSEYEDRHVSMGIQSERDPFHPPRSFFKQLDEKLTPYGYECYFEKIGKSEYFNVELPEYVYSTSNSAPAGVPRIEVKIVDLRKKYYRKLCRVCHPDKNDHAEWATHAMKLINQLFEKEDVAGLQALWEYYEKHGSFLNYSFPV